MIEVKRYRKKCDFCNFKISFFRGNYKRSGKFAAPLSLLFIFIFFTANIVSSKNTDSLSQKNKKYAQLHDMISQNDFHFFFFALQRPLAENKLPKFAQKPA